MADGSWTSSAMADGYGDGFVFTFQFSVFRFHLSSYLSSTDNAKIHHPKADVKRGSPRIVKES